MEQKYKLRKNCDLLTGYETKWIRIAKKIENNKNK